MAKGQVIIIIIIIIVVVVVVLVVNINLMFNGADFAMMYFQ